MKFLYLLLKEHSRFFIREIIIMAQVMFLIYSIAMCTGPIAYSIATNTAIRQSIHQKAIYMNPYSRIKNIVSGYSSHTREEKEALSQQVEESVQSVDGLIGQGEISLNTLSIGNQSCYAFCYSDDLIKYIQLPLEEGHWFSDEIVTINGRVPVIVGGTIKGKYEVGQEFEGKMSGMTSESVEEVTIPCVVVGILGEEDVFFRFDSYGSEPQLGEIARRRSDSKEEQIPILIMPQSTLPEEIRSLPDTNRLLFLDDRVDEQQTVEKLNDTYGELATFHTIDELFQNQIAWDLQNANTYVVLAGVLFLLCIFGLGGYLLLTLSENESIMGVYSLCGMTTGKMAAIVLIPVFFLLLIPTVIMSFLSAHFIPMQSTIDISTYVLSILLVVLVFCISAAVALLRMKRMKPVDLIREEDS